MTPRASATIAVAVLAAIPSAAGATQPLLAPYLVMPAAGAPRVGAVVSVEPGVWDTTPAGFAVTWQRCEAGTLRCADIVAATGMEYRPVAADVGATLRALVRPSGVAGADGVPSATSPVVGGPQVPVTPGAGTVGGGAVGDGPSETASGAPLTAGLASRLRLRFGAVAQLAGTLLAPGGGAVPGAPLELRDPSGAILSVGRSDDDGAFRIAARFTRPGTWTVSGDGWERTVRVELRPVVRVLQVSRTVRAPGVVRIAGSVRPPVGGKLVQLQYLDPGRGWRLWQQVATERGGRFVLARLLRPNPRAPRFTLRIRVAVPTDIGWPYAPAVTSTVLVNVN